MTKAKYEFCKRLLRLRRLTAMLFGLVAILMPLLPATPVWGQAGIAGVISLVAQGKSERGTLAAGASHSLALTEAGAVYAWGWNYYGQLGLWDEEDRLTPTKVPGFSLGRRPAVEIKPSWLSASF